MNPVEIMPIQGALVLRARGSELLIMPHHVVQLKQQQSTQQFSSYFTTYALINRSARKLFEAWLRKDRSLWQRIYKTVKEMEIEEENNQAETLESGSSDASHDNQGTEAAVSESEVSSPLDPDLEATEAPKDQPKKKSVRKKKATPRKKKAAAVKKKSAKISGD